jgi:SAM-dependent methyltransferase
MGDLQYVVYEFTFFYFHYCPSYNFCYLCFSSISFIGKYKMTEQLWNIYLKLQTVIPYGDTWANASQDDGHEPDFSTRQYISKWVDISSVKHALTIGPGGPQELKLLKVTFPESVVYALTAHKPEADTLLAKGYKVEWGDMHNSPYKNASMHVVFASNVLEHSISPYIALMEIRRILTNPGWALFIVPSFAGKEGGIGPYHLHCLDFNVWSELLKKTGFQILDKSGIEGKHGDSNYCRFLCKTVALLGPHETVFKELCVYRREQLSM